MSPRDPSRLTARQREILDYIREYSRENSFPPAVRDIGNRFGVNPATVHDHLKALERKGYIVKQPNLSRSLSVVERRGSGKAAVGGTPLVGRVAAGAPILAEENIEDTVHLPEGWAPDGGFLLRVEGASMRDAHILDGDLVLVKPQATATNGEIVVARLGDEATVKRFYKTRRGIELRPDNPAYDPIRLSASESAQFAIVGKVVGVFRHDRLY